MNNEIFYERFGIKSDHADLCVYTARKIFLHVGQHCSNETVSNVLCVTAWCRFNQSFLVVL